MLSELHPEPKNRKLIEFDCQDAIYSVAFLVDGQHIVSGGTDKFIRCWKVEDGKEAGTQMDAPGRPGDDIFDIAVSQDGKWIVAGTDTYAGVWNAKTHENVLRFGGYQGQYSVDVSPDGTRIASGSNTGTAGVFSLSTGQRLLGPWRHDYYAVAAMKFSPDGRLVATATWWRNSVRIYDSQDGHLLVDFPIQVSSPLNTTLAWALNSKQLFALSFDGNIHCLDVYIGRSLSEWSIHTSDVDRGCIALAPNGRFVACSAASSVSFWDTVTHHKIGPVLEHGDVVRSMDISVNYKIVTGAGKRITLWNLHDLLPPLYLVHPESMDAERVDKSIENRWASKMRR